MEVIVVSGTPGTGKTTYSKQLCQKNKYMYLDVKKLLSKDVVEVYDKKRDTKIVDIDKLNKKLIAIIKKEQKKAIKGIVIDSHLGHYIPRKYVNKVVITKCSLPELKKRLEERKYSEEKVKENMESEIFDVCRIEALEFGHDVETVDTD